MLLNSHGKINSLRLAVTDKCNLRCFCCMPEQGLDWLLRTELVATLKRAFITREKDRWQAEEQRG